MPTAALTYRRWVARSIARALLADAEQPCARLKAHLHRCATRGVQPDDDAAALRGHIGWVGQLNPARAAKLQAWFDRIDWTRAATDG